MPTLTDRQAAFVHHLVTTGCTQTEAARVAGYSEPKQEAYRLTRLAHVRAAIHEERERVIMCYLPNVALQTIKEVMLDKSYPASARVSAARTAFEVAGMFDKTGRDTATGKTLQEMSAEELSDTIRRLDDRMTEFAGSSAIN